MTLIQEIEVMYGENKLCLSVKRPVPGERGGGMPNVELVGAKMVKLVDRPVGDIGCLVTEYAKAVGGQIEMKLDSRILQRRHGSTQLFRKPV